MALGALAAEAEDLIGDLLKEAEEMAKAADDSATNVGAPDMPPAGKWPRARVSRSARRASPATRRPTTRSRTAAPTSAARAMADRRDRGRLRHDQRGRQEHREAHDAGPAPERPGPGRRRSRREGHRRRQAGLRRRRRVRHGRRRPTAAWTPRRPGSLEGLEALMAKTAGA